MLTVESLEREVRRLREENDELHETVRLLQSRPQDDPLPIGMPKFTPTEERVVRLILFKDEPVSRGSIYRALYDDERVAPKIIDVMLCRIREKLDGTQFAVVNVPWHGWRIVHDINAGRAAA